MSLRQVALAAFDAALAAAAPGPATARALAERPLAPGRPVTIIAMGKAAIPMARAAIGQLGRPPKTLLIVTNPENAVALDGAEIFAAAHPLPDAIGLAAAARALEIAASLTAEDQLLVLVSGGASAMLPSPVPGVSLSDKITLNAQMLAANMDIRAMNLVRQNLSALKGGGLARAAGRAVVRSLILSDVPGDELAVVASGPTLPPIGPRSAAVDALQKSGLWAGLAPNIRAVLTAPAPAPAPAPATAAAPLPPADATLIGANQISIAAACAAIPPDYLLLEAPYPLIGTVESAAETLAALARAAPNQPCAIVTGGETTVNVTGTGRGGRNQELALRIALALALPRDWLFLSAGTDGRDGPTDAAGGIVTGDTARAIAAAGHDSRRLLANNDSYAALAAGDALLHTGATATNVGDCQILLLNHQ